MFLRKQTRSYRAEGRGNRRRYVSRYHPRRSLIRLPLISRGLFFLIELAALVRSSFFFECKGRKMNWPIQLKRTGLMLPKSAIWYPSSLIKRFLPNAPCRHALCIRECKFAGFTSARAFSVLLLLDLRFPRSSASCAGLGNVGLACLYFLCDGLPAVYFPRAEGRKSLLAGRLGDDFIAISRLRSGVVAVDIPFERVPIVLGTIWWAPVSPCQGVVEKGLRLEKSIFSRKHRDWNNLRRRWNVNSVKWTVSSSSSLLGESLWFVGDFEKIYRSPFHVAPCFHLSRVSCSPNACEASQPRSERFDLQPWRRSEIGEQSLMRR